MEGRDWIEFGRGYLGALILTIWGCLTNFQIPTGGVTGTVFNVVWGVLIACLAVGIVMVGWVTVKRCKMSVGGLR